MFHFHFFRVIPFISFLPSLSVYRILFLCPIMLFFFSSFLSSLPVVFPYLVFLSTSFFLFLSSILPIASIRLIPSLPLLSLPSCYFLRVFRRLITFIHLIPFLLFLSPIFLFFVSFLRSFLSPLPISFSLYLLYLFFFLSSVLSMASTHFISFLPQLSLIFLFLVFPSSYPLYLSPSFLTFPLSPISLFFVSSVLPIASTYLVPSSALLSLILFLDPSLTSFLFPLPPSFLPFLSTFTSSCSLSHSFSYLSYRFYPSHFLPHHSPISIILVPRIPFFSSPLLISCLPFLFSLPSFYSILVVRLSYRL